MCSVCAELAQQSQNRLLLRSKIKWVKKVVQCESQSLGCSNSSSYRDIFFLPFRYLKDIIDTEIFGWYKLKSVKNKLYEFYQNIYFAVRKSVKKWFHSPSRSNRFLCSNKFLRPRNCKNICWNRECCFVHCWQKHCLTGISNERIYEYLLLYATQSWNVCINDITIQKYERWWHS